MIQRRTPLKKMSDKRAKAITDGSFVKKRSPLKRPSLQEMKEAGVLQRASSLTSKPRKRLKPTGSSPLQKLDAQLVPLFSRMVRKRAADSDGFVHCYICGQPIKWEDAVLMHFQGRKNKSTRFNEMSCKAGCWECNDKPLGDRKNFAKKIDEEYYPGCAELLTDASKQECRLTREWYSFMINYCNVELAKLDG